MPPSRHKTERAASLPPATELMQLAPMVVWMRAPQLAFEQMWPWYGVNKQENKRAVFEKMAAVMEGYGAMNAEMAHAWATLWIACLDGKSPDAQTIARAWQDVCDASMQPSARRVRANYKRLVAKRVPLRRSS